MADITADVSLVGALEIETDVRGVRGESAYEIAVRDGFVGTEEEWLASLKGDPGTPGQDGHSPVITATESNGTTTVTADGTVIATINDGQDGQDGHSPVITTSKSGKTTTILADGTSIGTVLDGNDGQDGEDGITPSFSIGTVQSGQTAAASITGTDANPVLNLTLPKGDDGQAGQGIPTGGTQGQVLKKSSGTDYDAEWADESDAVTDVQINGNSVVSDGVANVPIANGTTPGVVIVRVGSDGLLVDSSNRLNIASASNNNYKNGDNNYRPVTPYNQHQSVFYGLAKASGDTTQSQSSNAVGNYTEEAKIAIQKMLGIYEAPWELIADVTTTENVEEVVIDTDTTGQPFELTEMIVSLVGGPSTTGNRDNFRQNYGYTYNNGSLATGALPAFQSSSGTANIAMNTKVKINQNAPVEISVVASANIGSSNAISSVPSNIVADGISKYRVHQYSSTTSLIPSGTNIKLYGKRKWN